ncbi:MAG TPA: isopentenyl-diphosphate Delta-isomerase [Kiritimatiellia bacterium]|nr:isopentenyl-diphosphate Delta-isomerase [Kiritimatiellia bacterium]
MAAEFVILVDEQDRPVGRMEKLAAHEHGGTRHRAFSVFLVDAQGRWLLQRRAAGKYHFPNLWTNACCSHPRPGEETEAAAHRRLREELGVACDLTHRFRFEYKATSAAEGLTEHEMDHVFTGVYVGELQPNPEEVSEIRWVSRADLEQEVAAHPERFTPWFKLAMVRVREWL